MSGFPIEIQDVEGAGRGAFASRDVVAGEVLIRNAPAALVPCDAAFVSGSVCSHCLVDLNVEAHATPPRCSGPCKLAVFCDRCGSDPEVHLQHADECASLEELFNPATNGMYVGGGGGAEQNTDVLRVVLRLLHLRTRCLNGKGPRPIAALHASDEDLLVDEFAAVEEMDDHEDGGRLPDAEWDRMTALAKKCQRLAGSSARASLRVCVELLLRLDANGFGAYRLHEMELRSRTFHYKDRGRGLYPSASFFNHSCRPNASFYTDNLGCLVVVATADVPAGTQFCIPYISVATRKDTVAKRQEKLRKEYLFECRCERCVEELRQLEALA